MVRGGRMTDHRCTAMTVARARCSCRGAYEHEGRLYCGNHHPVWRARHQAARRARTTPGREQRAANDLLRRERNLMRALRTVRTALTALGLRESTRVRRLA